jgi:hypothetical protein
MAALQWLAWQISWVGLIQASHVIKYAPERDQYGVNTYAN